MKVGRSLGSRIQAEPDAKGTMTGAPINTDALMEEIREFCDTFGIAESTFGRHAVNDGKHAVNELWAEIVGRKVQTKSADEKFNCGQNCGQKCRRKVQTN